MELPSLVGLERLVIVAAWVAAGACVGTVLWRIPDGFDLTDEASYLLAASPPHPGDGFNGLSGAYLRPLWVVSGWNVATIRVLGLVGLVGAGVLLGQATGRLLQRPAGLVIALTVAASTGYYASGLRTPSYNWLAIVGAQVICAVLLRLLAGESTRWGMLAGAALVVSAAGKMTTAVVLAMTLVLVALATRRASAIAWATAAGAVVHGAAVLPVGETVRLLQRSAAFLGVLDPSHYTATGSLATLVTRLPLHVLAALVGGGVLGLLPVAAMVRREEPARRLTASCLVAVGGAALVALVTGVWSGVLDRRQSMGGGVLPVVMAASATVLVGRLSPLSEPFEPARRRRLAGAAVLVVATLGYLLGSNVWPDDMAETATGLLAPACLLLGGLRHPPARPSPASAARGPGPGSPWARASGTPGRAPVPSGCATRRITRWWAVSSVPAWCRP